MLTPWGEALDKNAVLQEYPRPQLVRESYYNLNGLWDYAITASDACPGAWDGEILVPFSPEAPLSGARLGQCQLDSVINEVKDIVFPGKAHLDLGRVHIHVHRAEPGGQMEDTAGKFAHHLLVLIGLLQGGGHQRAFHAAGAAREGSDFAELPGQDHDALVILSDRGGG